MKNLIVFSLFLISVTAQSNTNVIYGKDNRLDLYQVTNPTLLKLAASTAGMIPVAQFVKGSRQGVFDLQNCKTSGEADNLCTSEAFHDQFVAPICSGFLVGPDVMVTAGHCYNSFSTPENVCRSFAWVFDYSMKSAKANPTKDIPMDNIYRCKSIISTELSDKLDYTVIRLDRPVVGRSPLKFRTSGVISGSASLLVIGHPSALPTKIAAGAKITNNSLSTRFNTTLDTFHGNSGSAVFDAGTGVVEGILIQGKTDYVPSVRNNPNSCQVVNKCDDSGKNCLHGSEPAQIEAGEVVLRIGTIAPILSRAIGR